MHHSRDTPEKQWSETVVISLNGVCKIFVSFKDTFFAIKGFDQIWKHLTNELKTFATVCKNTEVSDAAIKCFQDLVDVLVLKTGSTSSPNGEECSKLWTPLWVSWAGIGKELLFPSSSVNQNQNISNSHQNNSTNLTPSAIAPFIPSQQFLSIYVKQFIPIFTNLKKVFTKNDFDCFAQGRQNNLLHSMLCSKPVAFMLKQNLFFISSQLSCLELKLH